jgi:hypothetical protein
MVLEFLHFIYPPALVVFFILDLLFHRTYILLLFNSDKYTERPADGSLGLFWWSKTPPPTPIK